MADHKTQRERADDIVAKIRLASVEAMAAELSVVIEESQNDPPYGFSDGSIDAVRWRRYRALRESLDRMVLAVKSLK